MKRDERRQRNLTDEEARWQLNLENKRTATIGIHDDDNIKDTTRKRTIVAAISGEGFVFDEEINNIKEMATTFPLLSVTVSVHTFPGK